MSIDGNDRRSLGYSIAWDLNVIGDRMFFTLYFSTPIYTMRTDGSDLHQLSDDEAQFINVVGDRIYFCNMSDGGKIYTMDIDGSDKHKICDDESSYLSVVGDKIYYSNLSDNRSLYTMSIDGSDRYSLNGNTSAWINVAGDWIMYNDWSIGGFYFMRTDGSGWHKVGTPMPEHSVATTSTSTDTDFEYSVMGNTVTITGYSGSGGHVIIPSVIGSKNVTSIDTIRGWGRYSSSITSIILPNTLTTIGWGAFYGTSLTDIIIPSSVTTISPSSSYSTALGDPPLTSIEVDPGNSNYSSDDGVLLNKRKTTILQCPRNKTGTYTIPESVTAIEDRAFSRSQLSSITVPDSVISIPDQAFWPSYDSEPQFTIICSKDSTAHEHCKRIRLKYQVIG